MAEYWSIWALLLLCGMGNSFPMPPTHRIWNSRGIAPCMIRRSFSASRLNLRPPKGSGWVREGRGEEPFLQPGESVPPVSIKPDWNDEDSVWLEMGDEEPANYEPVKGYAGTLPPAQKSSEVDDHWDDLPNRVLHPFPAFMERPMHCHLPIPFPPTPSIQVALALANRTCQAQFEEEAKSKPPGTPIVARSTSGFVSTWDAVMMARNFVGECNDPKLQRHLEWGMPEHSPTKELPYPVRHAPTMTREDLLDEGFPIEEWEQQEKERQEKEKEFYSEDYEKMDPNALKPDPKLIELMARLQKDPDYIQQQARAAAVNAELEEDAMQQIEWETSVTHEVNQEQAVQPSPDQFRARSLYEYTDWGEVNYQADKAFHESASSSFLDPTEIAARFDKEAYIRMLEKLPKF